ncbi:MAG: cell wall-binding repeat-containing protein [Firmicutes bacterium]|nr:cell wall-binding repeat-containing protein [Bacillota bacterium]
MMLCLGLLFGSGLTAFAEEREPAEIDKSEETLAEEALSEEAWPENEPAEVLPTEDEPEDVASEDTMPEEDPAAEPEDEPVAEEAEAADTEPESEALEEALPQDGPEEALPQDGLEEVKPVKENPGELLDRMVTEPVVKDADATGKEAEMQDDPTEMQDDPTETQDDPTQPEPAGAEEPQTPDGQEDPGNGEGQPGPAEPEDTEGQTPTDSQEEKPEDAEQQKPTDTEEEKPEEQKPEDTAEEQKPEDTEEEQKPEVPAKPVKIRRTYTRLAGSNRYETAQQVAEAVKAAREEEKFDHIIIASGLNFPDALSGGYLAAVKNAPILLINGNNVKEIAAYAKENLKEGGTVYILGGKGSVSGETETELEGVKVRRLAGKNRYLTNLAILRAAGTKAPEYLICSGEVFPDALAAAATRQPIMLVAKSGLNEQQTAYMEKLQEMGKKFVIVGGTGSVTKATMKQVKAYGKTSRVAGDDRYETAVKIAEKYFPEETESVIVACGEDYPDALAGGALAVAKGAPVLLASVRNFIGAYNYTVDAKAKDVVVVGGKKLVPDSVLGGKRKADKLFSYQGRMYYVKPDGKIAVSETVFSETAGCTYLTDGNGWVTQMEASAKGIDVSEFNATINWKKVAKSGISFAFIRVGGRYGVRATIYDDERFVENIKGAAKAGIKTGVYFFTQAITVKEAIQEANYTLEKVKDYQIDLPIVFDTEFMYNGRHNNLDKQARTKVARAFCERVRKAGYTPMIYASSTYLRDELDLTQLPYDIWVAEWTDKLSYQGPYRFWQYAADGQVDGITGNVDLDYMFGEYKL